MPVKIKDVADAAQVSIATVSYVLNNSAPVSEATRRRVLEAVNRLGYRPNITARNLKASEARIIGYAWHDIPDGVINPVLDRFIYQMALAAEARGYHVLTFTQQPEKPVRAYQELIRTSRVDGFILSGTVQDDDRIRMLMEHGFPFVAFGRGNPEWDFPYVDVDSAAGVRMAVEHLIANGHHKIAILAWPEGSINGGHRLTGYFEAMHAAGLPIAPGWISRVINRMDAGQHAAAAMRALPADERPTAIVGLTDTLAIGAMRAVEAAGLRPGIDIAVTGFDDDPVAAFLRPALTSVRQPLEEIGPSVVDLLVAILSGEDCPQQQLIAPRLIIRDSSRFTQKGISE